MLDLVGMLPGVEDALKDGLAKWAAISDALQEIRSRLATIEATQRLITRRLDADDRRAAEVGVK